MPTQPYEGSSLVFTCPIDGLSFGTRQPLLLGDLTRDTGVGHHFHVAAPGVMECANGHQWQLEENFVLERVR